jgi:hypothetical protein
VQLRQAAIVFLCKLKQFSGGAYLPISCISFRRKTSTTVSENPIAYWDMR